MSSILQKNGPYKTHVPYMWKSSWIKEKFDYSSDDSGKGLKEILDDR